MAPRLPNGSAPKRRQQGFGYLLVLLLVVLMGIGLGAAGSLWKTESQRVKENELLFVGEAYRQAIRSYYTAPGPAKQYPKRLEDLLLDTRQTQLTRHLRKLYPDPMTGKTEWGLIQDTESQQIRGVYSLAPGKPWKQQGFDARQKGFENAENYTAWQFVVTGTLPTPSPGSKAPVAAPVETPNPPSDTDN